MTECRNSAKRRYRRRFCIAMVAYAITLVLGIIFVRNTGITGPLAWMSATLPGLCIVAVFWAMGRLLVEDQDEFQRLLLARAMLIASGITLSIATIWGFLENFGLVVHIETFYVSVIWFISLGIGSYVNRLTLGADGSL